MPMIAHMSDPLSCGDFIAAGSGDVFADNLPVAYLGSATTGHPVPGAFFPPSSILSPVSATVFINGLPAAMTGSMTIPHCIPGNCHPGSVISASTVNIT